MSDDIVTRLLEMLDGSVPSTAEPQDLRDAIDEIERLRHELGMAHANLAMYIDCTAAAEIERLRTALQLAVGELSTHDTYRLYSPDQLYQQFLEEVRRG